jgi:hypothetical protein
VPTLEIAQCTKEINSAEIRPERLCKVKLAVCTLPKQEATEALLTRGSDQ